MRKILLVGIFLGVLLIASVSWGQNPTLVNDLVFGNMYPGIPKVVDKTSAGEAAEFNISGSPGIEVIVTFTLPEYLYSSGFNYQLVFSSTDLSADTRNTPNQSSPLINNLDPREPFIQRLGIGGLTLWLGGTAIPKLVQQVGDYSATIVMTVDTTGG